MSAAPTPFEETPFAKPFPSGQGPVPLLVCRKRLPLILACVVLALLIVGPGAAYFWIRWDSAWLKPDETGTVIAVRFDDPDDRSLDFHRGVSAAFLAAGTTRAFESVKCRVGSRNWPRKYAWTQITIPRKPLPEMKSLLPQFLVSVEDELAEIGVHPAYRIAIVDPSGAVLHAK